MAELKLKIPDDLEEDIGKHSNISWSKVFEKAAKEQLAEVAKRQLILSALNKLFANSKLTDKDALELGRKVNESMYNRLKEQGFM